MAVNTPHKQYDQYSPQWKRLRDSIAGQDAVHAAKKDYLPKLTGQSDDEYKAYVKRALFYGATSRTVDGLTGMIFRKSPIVELPNVLQRYEEDVTLDGLSLQGFAEQIVDDVVSVGRCGILVDHPVTTDIEGLFTVAQAEQQNIRPFLKHYKTEAILNWRTAGVNNEQVLIELRLLETVEEPTEDEFEYNEVEQIRVLDLIENKYRQRIYRKDEKKKEWIQFGPDEFPQMNGDFMDFIPFVFINPKNTSADAEKPPLIDLADANLSHYRTTADLEHGAHFTALPTAVITGFTEATEDDDGGGSDFRIGSATAWVFPSPETEAKYLEFEGQGLEALEKRAKTKEEYMAFLGARMLAPDKRAIEAAETAQIHRQGENSVLASLAQSVSDGIGKALKIFLQWLNTEGKIKFELNKDFVPAIMTAQDLTAIMQLWQSGGIAFTDLLWNLKRGEIVSEDREEEDIKSEVETENPFQGQDLPPDELDEDDDDEEE